MRYIFLSNKWHSGYKLTNLYVLKTWIFNTLINQHGNVWVCTAQAIQCNPAYTFQRHRNNDPKVCCPTREYNVDSITTSTQYHDDVIKWKHFPRYWPFVRGIHRSPVNSPHKGQWRGALMFSFICARINSRVNNGEAGDLRRHRAHCDVIGMQNKAFIVRDQQCIYSIWDALYLICPIWLVIPTF